MAQFSEANSVRDFIRDLVKSIDVQFVPGNELPRRTDEVLLEGVLKGALMRLNPEIEKDPAKADEVIYNLRAILIAAPLVRPCCCRLPKVPRTSAFG